MSFTNVIPDTTRSREMVMIVACDVLTFVLRRCRSCVATVEIKLLFAAGHIGPALRSIATFLQGGPRVARRMVYERAVEDAGPYGHYIGKRCVGGGVLDAPPVYDGIPVYGTGRCTPKGTCSASLHCVSIGPYTPLLYPTSPAFVQQFQLAFSVFFRFLAQLQVARAVHRLFTEKVKESQICLLTL